MCRFQTRFSAAEISEYSDQALWPLGTHLVSGRTGYLHHGIYVGNGKVIHYAGLCESLKCGPVEEVSLRRFAARNDIYSIEESNARYQAEDAVVRARSRLGECQYRLLTNNCEHFCNWCLYGEAWSYQVRRFWVDPIFASRLILCFVPVLLGWKRRAGLHRIVHN